MTPCIYTRDGKRLIFAAKTLSAVDLASGSVATIRAPQLGAEDVFTFLATSPTAANTLAAATLERDILLSQDGGAAWKQIADNGLDLAAVRRP